MIAVAGMTCMIAVARMSGMSLVTGMPAVAVVVVVSVIGMVHGLNMSGVPRFVGPHMLMILLVVHASNIYPLGVQINGESPHVQSHATLALISQAL